MSRWSGLLGFVGLVVLLFGVAGELALGGSVRGLTIPHFILGACLIVVWFVMSGSKSLGQAGSVAVGRTARFSFNAALYTLVCVGLLVVLNYLAHRHDQRVDLTEQGVYSLSPQSRQVVKDLKKPLKLVGFRFSDPRDEEVKELLERYRYENPDKVSVDIINPRSQPHLVDNYGMKQGNVLYLEYGEGDVKGVSRINEASEQAVTNAIIKLTRGDAKKVYVVSGHGEPSLDGSGERDLGQLKAALADEHFTVESLFLGDKEGVPEDAAAVLLVAPERPLLESERTMLKSYVDQGGRLLLFHDVQTTDEVRTLASQFGITVEENVVLDLVQRLFAGPALGVQILVTDFGSHPITRTFRQDDRSVFELASSVRPTDAAKEGITSEDGVTYTSLLKSSPNSWGEKNVSALFDEAQPSAALDPDDSRGPVSLAVAYEKKLAKDGDETDVEKVSRVVVFGDSDFIRNSHLGYFANRDLILNAVNWASGEEGGITIGRKSIRPSMAPISRDQFLWILALSLLLPEALLLLGLLVWWRRKTYEVAGHAA